MDLIGFEQNVSSKFHWKTGALSCGFDQHGKARATNGLQKCFHFKNACRNY
jgi:hypothetical protein